MQFIVHALSVSYLLQCSSLTNIEYFNFYGYVSERSMLSLIAVKHFKFDGVRKKGSIIWVFLEVKELGTK